MAGAGRLERTLVSGPPPGRRGRVVLLAGPGDTTDIVANELMRHVPELLVVVEGSPSRVTMARRRAARVGWPTVIGQVLFVTVVLPVLRVSGRRRITAIAGRHGLDTTPVAVTRSVGSVNDDDTVEFLREARPDLVVVNGTRIIASRVLESIPCPIVNTHAGITPRYRGVHGGYWALAEGHPELVGTTVHLVDQGIDTGGVLARATFPVTSDDTIATYPYLHLAAGLPLLVDQVTRALDGRRPEPLVEAVPEGGTRLYLHPTVWGYLWRRMRSGVR